MAAQELNETSLISDGNLEAYYRLEGNFNDSSGNGFNGSGSTSPTSVPSGGMFGGAYDWNGTTDNVRAILTGKTPFNGTWTMNCWVEPDGVGEGAANDYGRIFDMGGKTNLRWSAISGSDMKMRFTQSYSGPDGGWETDSYVVPTNTFSMITVVFNGATAGNAPTIYVNGSSVSVTNYASPTGTIETSTTFNIGNNSNSGVRTFDGVIDDMALFSRALTAQEIADLYDLVTASGGSNAIFFGGGGLALA